MDSVYRKILSAAAPADFVGRTNAADAVRRHAADANQSRRLLLLSAPAAGASEILKQTYDGLFHEQGATIPVYFSVKAADRTAVRCAARFLHEFITQIVAFRRRDARVIDVAPEVAELVELAAPEDGFWINRLVAGRTESRLNDDRAFIKSCLSAPLRAAAYGAKVFVMLDDLHEADFFFESNEGDDFLAEISEVFNRSDAPYVLAGRRRFLHEKALTQNAARTDAEILNVEPLDFADAGRLTENLAARYAIEITAASRDLIARQFAGSPTFIRFLMQAAHDKRTSLDSFQRVEQIYTDELFGGRIGKFYDAALDRIVPPTGTQKQIIKLLHEISTAAMEKPTAEVRLKEAGADEKDFDRVWRLLNTHEIVRRSSDLIEPAAENEVLSDYLAMRYRLEIAGENRAATVGAMLSQLIKRAPQTMAKFYRQQSAINLRELLATFNRQETPVHLLDYAVYKERLEQAETNGNAASEAGKIRLPQMIYTAHTAAFYPPFAQVAEKNRSAVALGFEADGALSETVWLAAEIDSKLEASREKAEFWCDRLEMVALTCNFPKYKIWLIAPEGFAPDALEVLSERDAYGSSRRQVEQLANFLQTAAETTEKTEKTAAREYEIVVPMGDDTELIAANALEEIARRHQFAPKAINQIKTALVEACINATEHSLSPDRKIYQKFVVEDDRIVVTVANRGLRLLDVKRDENAPTENRRGWGLKLMQSLMDEVVYEQVDDGTRISMTKYLK